MKLLIILIVTTLSFGFHLDAKETTLQLAASSIPENLKKNAHAVLRYHQTELTIKGIDKISLKRKYAYTVLDKQGAVHATLLERYNLLVKIEEINGRLLDEQGKEIRVLKNKDILDRSSYGISYAFHDDSRIKAFSFNYSTYPYTVEFEVIETIKTTFFIPSWQVQPSEHCSVENTSFILNYPTSLSIRFKEYLMPAKTQRTTSQQEANKRLTWEIKHLEAYERQPFSKTGNYTSPTVIVASDNFDLLGYKGSMQSWQKLGAFMFMLNNERDKLPEDKKAVVKSIIQNETDNYSKIQKLYAYMQQNTRYVANEYGISGWQTFDAASVAQNGYGDCKGLTNYLKALLKEAGINSYAALVDAGESDYHQLDEQFTSNTFNHVILCVPQHSDSVWIECTSQRLPAGYLGSFTQGRKVLLITETGGYVCQTPAYGKDKNFIVRKTNFSINNNTSGQLNLKLQHIYSGLMQDDLESFLKVSSRNKIEEMVNSKFSFPSYSINSFDYKHIGIKSLPVIQETADVMVTGITNATQKRTFINLAWMKNPMVTIEQTEARTVPFVVNQSFKITDSVFVDLPEGFTIESLPEAISMEFPFAKFETKFERSVNTISMIRCYEQNAGVYEASVFEQYQKMFRALNSSKEQMNIVLVNKL